MVHPERRINHTGISAPRAQRTRFRRPAFALATTGLACIAGTCFSTIALLPLVANSVTQKAGNTLPHSIVVAVDQPSTQRKLYHIPAIRQSELVSSPVVDMAMPVVETTVSRQVATTVIAAPQEPVTADISDVTGSITGTQQAAINTAPIPDIDDTVPALSVTREETDISGLASLSPANPEALVPLPPSRPAEALDNLLASPATPPRRPSGAVLAYAIPQETPAARAPVSPPPSVPLARNSVAVYDISASTVYLPNGEKLEAHSGLGNLMDQPSHVHVRNRGATPPATYVLSPREQLFHGVAALRLTPINSNVYGRDGFLAHTYMLGPRGDSNGCVSFRNYNRFLQAYRRGEITHLKVVTGNSRRNKGLWWFASTN